MSVHVGTSGWSYDHWDGVLYPPGTTAAGRLESYARHFDTVELNSSFYRWPRPAGFASWRDRVPEGFRFSVKAARGLTHAKRLREPDLWVQRMAAGWPELGARRAALLVQLRPDQQRDDARLAYFLSRLPPWMPAALELRHPSWDDDAVYELLGAYGAAYCVTSGAHLPCVLRVTAPFVYLRLHGPDREHLYAGSYTDDDLRWWADRIGEWAADGRDVYAYFNNDGHGHAVRNAGTLRRFLGLLPG